MKNGKPKCGGEILPKCRFNTKSVRTDIGSSRGQRSENPASLSLTPYIMLGQCVYRIVVDVLHGNGKANCHHAHSQNYEKRLLSSSISVCPSVRTERLVCQCTDFHEI